MTSSLGVGAALLSPLSMVIGFIIWDKHWAGSAYALNVFKCSFASFLLLIVVLFTSTTSFSTMFLSFNGFILILSAMVGIVVGDNTWLMALQMIGARRVIIVDAMKPLLAALLGHFLLDEVITPLGLCGMMITIAGVVVVSLESTAKSHDDSVECDAAILTLSNVEDKNSSIDQIELTSGTREDGDESITQTSERGLESKVRQGYIFSILNVILDCVGSVFTKIFGEEFNTWEINLIRFGSAAVVLAGLSLIGRLIWYYKYNYVYRKGDEGDKHSPLSSSENMNAPNAFRNDDEGAEKLWFSMPIFTMSSTSWMHVTFGVIFVTFLCPVLSIYALFTMDVAVCLTLTSLGPLYSLPLVMLMKKEKVTWRAAWGTIFACTGVIILTVL